MSYLFKEEDISHPRHKESREVKNVLVLQGGSLARSFCMWGIQGISKKECKDRYSSMCFYTIAIVGVFL
jgi:hypothetical protein